MRVPSGSTDIKIPFVASLDGARVTGLSSFTVYRSRNGGTATIMTTPTITELDATNMPGEYVLLLDEDTTIGAGSDTEIMLLSISAAGMDRVSIAVELYKNTNAILGTPASGTIAEDILITQDIAELNREHHTYSGNVWYIDPVNGNDSTGNGTKLLPYQTVTKAHTEATDNNHDLIILVPGAAVGQTVLDEKVTITKNYLFIRGPGKDFKWYATTTGDIITVSGKGVELSGFQLETHTTGTGHGINCTGDFLLVKDIYSEYTRGDAVKITNANDCIIQDNIFKNVGQSGAGNGITIDVTGGSSASYTKIIGNDLHNTQGDGIKITVTSGDVKHTFIHNNVIHESTGYGINVGAGATFSSICHNSFEGNTSGNINDLGSNTSLLNNEQYAKHSIATEARLAELDAANLPTDIGNITTQIGTAGDGLTNINLPDQTMNITGNLSGSVGSVTGNVGGNVTGSVGSVVGNVNGNVIGNVNGSVASVTGSVGSVTGSVGSVTGSVASVTGSVGSVAGNVNGSIGSLAAQAKADVNAECDTALADYDPPTNAEMEARTPTAAQLAYIVANAATGLPVTFNTAGGSTTAAVLNLVDSAAASATNDQYNGRLLVFTDGTLKGVVTDITDYDGETKVATITAIPFAPTSSHNARLI